MVRNILVILCALFAPFVSMATVKAAPPVCYSDNGGVYKASTCPSVGGDRVVVSYRGLNGQIIASGPVDNNCYSSSGSTGGTAVYNEGDCAGFATYAKQILINLCDASGGEWSSYAGGGQPREECSCPPGTSINATSQQCVAQASGGDGTGSTVPKAEGPKTDCDEAQADLTEGNCQIVGLLNTVFNFVSGGIALAVIGNIIYAGIQYSMAQGDPSAVTKSKNRIRGALLAFLIYLVLYAFLQWLIPGGVFFA